MKLLDHTEPHIPLVKSNFSIFSFEKEKLTARDLFYFFSFETYPQS